MKKLMLCGLLIAAFSTMMNATNGDIPKKPILKFIFTDVPNVEKLDPVLLEASLKVTPSATIHILGSGGMVGDCLCPTYNTDICGTIITAKVGNTWGPDALITDQATSKKYFGTIVEPIENGNGEVINFVFTNVTPVQ